MKLPQIVYYYDYHDLNFTKDLFGQLGVKGLRFRELGFVEHMCGYAFLIYRGKLSIAKRKAFKKHELTEKNFL